MNNGNGHMDTENLGDSMGDGSSRLRRWWRRKTAGNALHPDRFTGHFLLVSGVRFSFWERALILLGRTAVVEVRSRKEPPMTPELVEVFDSIYTVAWTERS